MGEHASEAGPSARLVRVDLPEQRRVRLRVALLAGGERGRHQAGGGGLRAVAHHARGPVVAAVAVAALAVEPLRRGGLAAQD